MKKLKKDNIVNFPSSLSEGEREVEAILFAAAEPLDIDTIESKISKKVTAGKKTIAVRIPKHRIARRLLKKLKFLI